MATYNVQKALQAGYSIDEIQRGIEELRAKGMDVIPSESLDFGGRFLENIKRFPAQALKSGEQALAVVPRSLASLATRSISEISKAVGGPPLTFPTREQAGIAANIPILREAIPFGETLEMPKSFRAPEKTREAVARQLEETSSGERPGILGQIFSELFTNPLFAPLIETAGASAITAPTLGLLNKFGFKPTPQALQLTPETSLSLQSILRRGRLPTETVKGIVEKEIPIPPKKGTPQARKALSEDYEKATQEVATKYGEKKFPNIASKTKKDFVEILGKSEITKKPVSEGKGLLFKYPSEFTKREKGMLQEMVDLVTKTKNETALDFNKVRQVLRRLNDNVQKAPSISPNLKRISQTLYNTFNNNIGEKIPEIRTLNQKYGQGISGFAEKAKTAKIEQLLRRGELKTASKEVETAALKFNKLFAKAFNIPAPTPKSSAFQKILKGLIKGTAVGAGLGAGYKGLEGLFGNKD